MYSLRLDSNQFNDPTTVQALADSVSQMTALRSLGLSNCSLSGEGSAALVIALGHLPSLTELKLDTNKFDHPTTGLALAASVSQMKALQSLRLESCHIDDITAVHIAEAAVNSPQLQFLWLQVNHITRHGRRRVEEICLGRVEDVELDGQKAPSEGQCGSLCDGGHNELFYQRPLSHDNTDSSDDDNLCLWSSDD
ncbi:hypothetical protein LSAT2_027384, partial [Lamellibrachia satsuma]